MNLVAIIGNVATSTELRHTRQGRAVCTFRVAVSRQGDEQLADFFDVVAWERQAEVCSQYLDVGRRIAVQGKLRCRVAPLEKGTDRKTVELVASRVELLGARQHAAAPVKQVEVTR